MNKKIENTIPYKYAEEEIIKDFKEYIDNTYSEHYQTEDQDHIENLQCFDLWIAAGSATTSFRDTSQKYLWRYGKKKGKNKNDLMKALHYILLMLYNEHYKKVKNEN